MVLMSFFIIFSEVSSLKSDGDKDQRPLSQVIFALQDKIAAPAQAEAQAQPPAQTGAPAEVAQPAPAPKTSALDVLLGDLKERNIDSEIDLKRSGILIHFPDNIYDEGEFAVNGQIRKRLQELLEPLQAHKDLIQVTFIGHTDTAPIKRLDKRIIDSNLVLSNLRASRAAEVALSAGFDPRWVTAEGMGEYARSTRSLSIRITERDGGANR